jgi:hypothetical protein
MIEIFDNGGADILQQYLRHRAILDRRTADIRPPYRADCCSLALTWNIFQAPGLCPLCGGEVHAAAGWAVFVRLTRPDGMDLICESCVQASAPELIVARDTANALLSRGRDCGGRVEEPSGGP